MPSKNETQFWIRYKGNTKLYDTKPELAIEDICKAFGDNSVDYFEGDSISFQAPDRQGMMKTWTVRPDRNIVFRAGRPFYMHADGPHHWTPAFRKKDDWQDDHLVTLGHAILRVDTPLLTDKRFWPLVWEKMVLMANSDAPKKRLYA